MAEGYFSYQLNAHHSSVTVSSAGLSAVVNYPAESHAQAVMKNHAIDISRHRARQVTLDLVRQSDLILVMTKNQRTTLEKQFLIAKGKTLLLGHWQNFEIVDPLNKPYETFEKIYHQIELAWQDWKTRILQCQICI